MTTRQYYWSANVIAFFHIIWALVLWLGAALVLFWPPFAWIQIGLLSFTLLIALPLRNNCPLTVLEERFRRKVEPGYTNQGSFLTTYLNKVFGARFSVRGVNTFLTFFYIASYATAILILVKQG